MNVWTFASLIEARMSVHAYCDDCRFHKPLDLAALAERIGSDRPAMSPDLRSVLVCPKCGSKRTSFIYSPGRGDLQMIEGAWSGPPRTGPITPSPSRTHRSRSRRRQKRRPPGHPSGGCACT